MPVQWTKIEVPLVGLDQKTAAPHVDVGRVLNAENVRMDEPGIYKKREGYTALTATTDLGTHQPPKRVFVHDETELSLFDERQLYGVSIGAVQWFNRGPAPKFWIERRAVARTDEIEDNITLSTNTKSYDWPDVGVFSSLFIVYAWHDYVDDNIKIAVVDRVTLKVLTTAARGDTSAALGHGRPRVVANSSTCRVFWEETDAIKYVTISNKAVIGSTTTFKSVTGLVGFDISPISGSTDVILAYGDATDVDLERFNSLWVSQATHTLAGENPVRMLAVEGTTGEECWVAYLTTVLKISAHTTSTLAKANAGFPVVADSSITLGGRATIGRISSSQVLLAFEGSDTNVYWMTVDDDTTLSTAAGSTKNSLGTTSAEVDTALVNRAFVHDSKVCIGVAYFADDTVDSTAYIYEVTGSAGATTGLRGDGTPVLLGVYARGLASRNGRTADFTGFPARVPASFTTGKFESALVVTSAFETIDDDKFRSSKSGIDAVTIDAATGGRYRTTPWGNHTFVAAGMCSYYDGIVIAECGHTMRPPVPVPGSAQAGGLLAANSTYKWKYVYEWEAQGELHRSAPSAEVSGSTDASNKSFDMTLPLVVPGNRTSALHGVRVVVYRTLADGDLYFYEGEGAPGAAYTTGDTTKSHLDADIEDNEPLYTDGGKLPNLGPPAAKYCITHQSRIWLGGLEEEDAVAYSQEREFGLAPEFNDAFIVRIPGGRRVTGIASLDNSVIVFSQSAIFAITGTGPDAKGEGGIYRVVPVATECGCIDARSIVTTGSGVMFQGLRGIYLLDRSLQVQKAGAEVDRILETYDEVRAAHQMIGRSEVLFALQDGDEEKTPVVLVLDQYLGQWTQDLIQVSTAIMEDITEDVFGTLSVVYWADSFNGVVRQSTAATYVDQSSPYSMLVESPNIRLDTIAGWQRTRKVMIVGRSLASHSLTVDFAYDDDSPTPTYTDTQVVSAATIATTGYPVQIGVPRQKARTLRVRIREDHATGTQGPEIIGLVLEVGLKQGVTKLAAAHKT